MRTCDVAEIRIDQQGRLLVIPAGIDPERQYIYRTASGIRWEECSNAYVAAAPERWEPGEFVGHMLHELRGELGDRLRLTEHTRWVNVAPEVRGEIAQIFGRQE